MSEDSLRVDREDGLTFQPAEDVAKIRALLRTVDSPRDAAAYETLFHSYLAASKWGTGTLGELSWDMFDYEEGSAVVFPRLTDPALVEPLAIEKERHWLVPLILRGAGVSGIFLVGESPHGAAARLRNRVAFWLVPHPKNEKVEPVMLNGCMIDLEDLIYTFDRGGTYTLPHANLGRIESPLLADQMIGLVFDLPASGGVTSPPFIQAGYYDIVMLPRLWSDPPEPSSCEQPRRALSSTNFAEALQMGDWYWILNSLSLRDADQRFEPAELTAAAEEIRYLIDNVFYWPYHFNLKSLVDIADRFDELAQKWDADSAAELRTAIRELTGTTPDALAHTTTAPVWLDDGVGDEWSFVVAADLQHHGDISDVRLMLDIVDPHRLPSRPAGTYPWALSPDVSRKLRQTKFIILAGDLGDGGAGSALSLLALNFFGLYPPRSPYDSEYPELASEFRRLSIPVKAIPGNHDGFVGKGGVLHTAASIVTAPLVLGHMLWTSAVSRGSNPFSLLNAINSFSRDYLPVLVSPGLLSIPYYDGLQEWHRYFGLHDFAFHFGGQSFIGLNSFGLKSGDRRGVGAVVVNWGGGVRRSDVDWFETMVGDAKAEGAGRVFVFMHHDPRAGTPSAATLSEERLGRYHQADATVEDWTLGYAGLAYDGGSAYIPVLTPTLHYTVNFLSDTQRFQHEWMRADECDDDYYGARPLIESINRNLDDQSGRGISHVFIGHDDVPLISTWAGTRSDIFPEDKTTLRPTHWYNKVVWPFFKIPSTSSPEWGAATRIVPRGRNATVVRLDDVGQTGSAHGFHIVTVKRNDSTKRICGDGVTPRWCVNLDWVPIPH